MFNHPAGGPAAAAATGGWGWGAGTPAGKSGGKGGTGEGHGQLASPTRATRGAQLEWQWGHVLTVPLPADDRHKVPDEDSVLQCGLCGTPRKAAAALRTAQGCRENEAKWFPKLRTWESMWHSASVSCSWASYPAATRRHSWNCCCPWPSPAVEKRSDLQKSLGGHSEAGKQEREKKRPRLDTISKRGRGSHFWTM